MALVARWLILCQAIESSGDESEDPAKNGKETRMTTNKVGYQKYIAMSEKLTRHRKKQKIFTQTQMSRTKIEQRPHCSARCKKGMGIETEIERGSGKQRITRSE